MPELSIVIYQFGIVHTLLIFYCAYITNPRRWRGCCVSSVGVLIPAVGGDVVRFLLDHRFPPPVGKYTYLLVSCQYIIHASDNMKYHLLTCLLRIPAFKSS